MLEDDQILELIRVEGKSEAGFRMLMKKYQEPLYWHIRNMVLIHEDADDVLQNTFVKIFKGLSGFKGNSKLYTWMYRIATNESLSLITRRKKKQMASLDDEMMDVEERLKSDSYFDGNKVHVLLQKALQVLPEKQKLVFNMRYFQNMSYKDIAAITDVSEGGLKASYHHAVKKIETYVRENGNV